MAHKNVTVSLSLVVAFLLGCVTAQVVIPPARAGTNPQRWEYMVAWEDDANKAGANGWELVAITSAREKWVFKRPSP